MISFGAALSADLFADPGWTQSSAEAVGTGPYPGWRPLGSWALQRDGSLASLRFSRGRWSVSDGREVDVHDRHLVIGYGSNPNPAKLVEHEALFDSGEIIALRAAMAGWAAVWCNGRRLTDGAVVATYVPMPSRIEVHPVFAWTTEQLQIVDEWEGHPTRYRRVAHDGPVLLESGEVASGVEVYLGADAARETLLVDGRPLLLADVAHAEVDRLVAPPAS